MDNVHKLILGTVQFGCQYGINSVGRPSENQVVDILQQAKNSGITILDTSSAYGEAEQVLGNTKASEDFLIVSKYPKGELSVRNMFEQSCKHLKTSHLYGYLLHHFEVLQNNVGIWAEFEALAQDGRVDKIGFSLYEPKELDFIIENHIRFNLVQIPYNLFDRQFEPYLKQLKDLGVEIHVRSTFLQGLFFMDRDTLPTKLFPLKPYLHQLDQYAREKQLSIAEIALNYNIQNPYIDNVLIGVDNTAQLIQNIQSISTTPIDVDIRVKEQELLKPVNWK